MYGVVYQKSGSQKYEVIQLSKFAKFSQEAWSNNKNKQYTDSSTQISYLIASTHDCLEEAQNAANGIGTKRTRRIPAKHAETASDITEDDDSSDEEVEYTDKVKEPIEVKRARLDQAKNKVAAISKTRDIRSSELLGILKARTAVPAPINDTTASSSISNQQFTDVIHAINIIRKDVTYIKDRYEMEDNDVHKKLDNFTAEYNFVQARVDKQLTDISNTIASISKTSMIDTGYIHSDGKTPIHMGNGFYITPVQWAMCKLKGAGDFGVLSKLYIVMLKDVDQSSDEYILKLDAVKMFWDRYMKFNLELANDTRMKLLNQFNEKIRQYKMNNKSPNSTINSSRSSSKKRKQSDENALLNNSNVTPLSPLRQRNIIEVPPNPNLSISFEDSTEY